MNDTYIPPADDTPDIPYHIRYRFSGGQEIGSAFCRGCKKHWSSDAGQSFVEWYREHVVCWFEASLPSDDR
jgi:hypothetical protein